jgi:hypothetical protein
MITSYNAYKVNILVFEPKRSISKIHFLISQHVYQKVINLQGNFLCQKKKNPLTFLLNQKTPTPYYPIPLSQNDNRKKIKQANQEPMRDYYQVL